MPAAFCSRIAATYNFCHSRSSILRSTGFKIAPLSEFTAATMQLYFVIELALLALFVAKSGLSSIERELLRQPRQSMKPDDTD
jgi:hypothetical protein